MTRIFVFKDSAGRNTIGKVIEPFNDKHDVIISNPRFFGYIEHSVLNASTLYFKDYGRTDGRDFVYTKLSDYKEADLDLAEMYQEYLNEHR